jgi:putative ABC transport system permease protein
MLGEFRYALRSLARSRGFTIAAILTLAIGIGAATAIYSVVDTVLLQPLPFPDSDRLVRLIEHFPTNVPTRPVMQRGITHQEFLDWRGQSKTLQDATAVIGMAQRMVKTPDGAAGLWGVAVSSNLFEMLRVQAMLGRTLSAADDLNPDVVVLSHDTWRRHFRSDPAILGKAIELRAGALVTPRPPRVLTVVGVLPADFELTTGAADYFAPIVLAPGSGSPQVITLARLAPGVSLEAASEEATRMGNAIRPAWPADRPPLEGPRFEVLNVKDEAVAPLRPALRVLLAAVGIVLLIVCANVANLMLARGTARQRELAVRLAIGASRMQVIRQVFAESILLAVAGGALGAVLGAAGVILVKQLAVVDAPGIFRLMFGDTILPRAHEVAVSWRLAAIAFSVAAITCIAFALLPALNLSRVNQLQTLAGRGTGATGHAARLRSLLVVGQLALATTLLVGAALLVGSFARLSTFDKGYDAANVLAFNLLFPDQYSTARKGEVIETLLGRFRANPEVRAAGFARHGLLIGEELYVGTFVPPGRTREEMRGIRTRSVSDGFLTAMAVPILEGREFSPEDSGSAPLVIVMNRSAAKRYFGDRSAIGQQMTWHVGKGSSQATVIGVVEDVRQESATDPLVPEIFFDYRQFLARFDGDRPQGQNETAIGFLSFALRTAGDPGSQVPRVREVINGVDPNIGIDAIVPLEKLEASSRARERFYAVLLGIFAAVAGLLGSIGVYGVLSYAVTQRTQEIGVRVALGALRSQVLWLILRRGGVLTAAGIVLGLGGAGGAARYLQSMLFGVKPTDATTFAAVAAAFAAVAMAACYLPARRATTVDPVVALRHE